MFSNAVRVSGLALLFCILIFNASINEVYADEYKKESLHAAFIFNFARFTEWPEEALPNDSKEIRFCVAGSELNKHATSQLSNKKIDKKKVVVHHLLENDEIRNCHLLFINSFEQKYVEKILKETVSRPVLTVGLAQDFLLSGGIIKLFNKEERIRFSVNTTELKKSNLKISSRILKLAIIKK